MRNIKNIRNNKKIVIIALYIILTILATATLAYIARYYYDIYSAKKQGNLLNEISINDSILIEKQAITQDNINLDFNDNTIYVKTDNTSGDTADNNTDNVNSSTNGSNAVITERTLKIEELQKQNPDIIGWIEITGTNISYPVLQGTDNNFYVSHNYKKERNISGAIFLDASYSWNPPSTNLLIYGHNNQNGTMFEDLLKYKSKKFYLEHPTIRFTTNTEDAYYEIFSAFESQVYYKSQSNVFKYYYFINANNEREFYEYVQNAKKSSIYNTGITAEYGEQLMTLSTCAYHTDNGRFVVVAKKIAN